MTNSIVKTSPLKVIFREMAESAGQDITSHVQLWDNPLSLPDEDGSTEFENEHFYGHIVAELSCDGDRGEYVSLRFYGHEEEMSRKSLYVVDGVTWEAFHVTIPEGVAMDKHDTLYVNIAISELMTIAAREGHDLEDCEIVVREINVP